MLCRQVHQLRTRGNGITFFARTRFSGVNFFRYARDTEIESVDTELSERVDTRQNWCEAKKVRYHSSCAQLMALTHSIFYRQYYFCVHHYKDMIRLWRSISSNKPISATGLPKIDYTLYCAVSRMPVS